MRVVKRGGGRTGGRVGGAKLHAYIVYGRRLFMVMLSFLKQCIPLWDTWF